MPSTEPTDLSIDKLVGAPPERVHDNLDDWSYNMLVGSLMNVEMMGGLTAIATGTVKNDFTAEVKLEAKPKTPFLIFVIKSLRRFCEILISTKLLISDDEYETGPGGEGGAGGVAEVVVFLLINL